MRATILTSESLFIGLFICMSSSLYRRWWESTYFWLLGQNSMRIVAPAAAGMTFLTSEMLCIDWILDSL